MSDRLVASRVAAAAALAEAQSAFDAQVAPRAWILARQGLELFFSPDYAMNADQWAIRATIRESVVASQPASFSLATGIVSIMATRSVLRFAPPANRRAAAPITRPDPPRLRNR